MKIDFKGHNGHPLDTHIDAEDLDAFWKDEFREAFEKALIFEKGIRMLPDFDWSELDVTPNQISVSRCSECGDRLHFNKINDILYECTSDCNYVGGIKPYSVIASIPSGRIVFGNDFRDLLAVTEPTLSVNYKHGRLLMTQAYENADLILIHVGDTSPTVYKIPNGELIVASLDNSEENISLGNICTDSSWYSAMDFDLFTHQCKMTKENEMEYFIVEVEPGKYEFTDNQCNPDEIDGDVIFSNIRKIG